MRTCSVELDVREGARRGVGRRRDGRRSGGRRHRPTGHALTGACESLTRRVLGARGALAGTLGRYHLRQRLDAVWVVEEPQDAVELQAPGRDADIPFELRTRQFPRDLE